MPYKDKEAQREYQRRWYNSRRSDWLAGKTCEECGDTEGLEIDHRDPKFKWKHNFWSYKEEVRNEELKKCQVLCQVHHLIKTSTQNNYSLPHTHGTRVMYSKHGCRCIECRAANTAHQRKMRANKISKTP